MRLQRNGHVAQRKAHLSLAVGKSCESIVVFFAADLGPLSATLNIPHNGTASPQMVPLSATVTKTGHSENTLDPRMRGYASGDCRRSLLGVSPSAL